MKIHMTDTTKRNIKIGAFGFVIALIVKILYTCYKNFPLEEGQYGYDELTMIKEALMSPTMLFLYAFVVIGVVYIKMLPPKKK